MMRIRNTFLRVEAHTFVSKMVKLQVQISQQIAGFVHVQTNPYHSYDTGKMVEDATSKWIISQLFLKQGNYEHLLPWI